MRKTANCILPTLSRLLNWPTVSSRLSQLRPQLLANPQRDCQCASRHLCPSWVYSFSAMPTAFKTLLASGGHLEKPMGFLFAFSLVSTLEISHTNCKR